MLNSPRERAKQERNCWSHVCPSFVIVVINQPHTKLWIGCCLLQIGNFLFFPRILLKDRLYEHGIMIVCWEVDVDINVGNKSNLIMSNYNH